MGNSTADSFIAEIKAFCNNKLKQPEDTERVIMLSFKNDQNDILEETAFYSKYLQGLLTIIQRGETSINEEVFLRYRTEYLQNVEKIRSNLGKIISHSDPFYKQIFSEKYLAVSQVSMNNLVDLIHDLSWVKMYLNQAKKNNI